MNNMWILAEVGKELDAPTGQVDTPETGTKTDAGSGKEDPTANGKGTTGNEMFRLLPFFAIFVIMFLFMSRGNKKKQKKHQTMVKSLQKNDKIRTVGGIIGTVLDVRDDEIVIKIDETNNTKMKVIPSAIASTLSEDTK